MVRASILDRIKTKIDAPLLTTLPLDRQFADFLFDPDACWRWVGAYSTGKRGSARPAIQLAGRGSPVRHVARVVLCLKDGIPVDEVDLEYRQAAHDCDNAVCVNPWHLQWMSGPLNRSTQRARIRSAEEILRSLGSL